MEVGGCSYLILHRRSIVKSIGGVLHYCLYLTLATYDVTLCVTTIVVLFLLLSWALQCVNVPQYPTLLHQYRKYSRGKHNEVQVARSLLFAAECIIIFSNPTNRNNLHCNASYGWTLTTLDRMMLKDSSIIL